MFDKLHYKTINKLICALVTAASAMWKLWLVLHTLFAPVQSSLNCPAENATHLRFHLVSECQRAATNEALALENTSSLEDCMQLARDLRGLALNYAPGGPMRHKNLYAEQPKNKDGKGTENRRYKDARRRLSVFQQPGEFFNCHVLQCPQNFSFVGMVNDSRFDYYSLYGRPIGALYVFSWNQYLISVFL